MRVHIAAAVVTILVFAAHRSMACPTSEDGAKAQRSGVSLVIAAGCTTPYGGRLYDKPMRAAVRGDIVQLETLVTESESALKMARAGLVQCKNDAADALDDCAASITPAPPAPPAPRRVWVWSAAGSTAAIAPLAACRFIDCGSDATPWAASLGAAVLVSALAWVIQ